MREPYPRHHNGGKVRISLSLTIVLLALMTLATLDHRKAVSAMRSSERWFRRSGRSVGSRSTGTASSILARPTRVSSDREDENWRAFVKQSPQTTITAPKLDLIAGDTCRNMRVQAEGSSAVNLCAYMPAFRQSTTVAVGSPPRRESKPRGYDAALHHMHARKSRRLQNVYEQAEVITLVEEMTPPTTPWNAASGHLSAPHRHHIHDHVGRFRRILMHLLSHDIALLRDLFSSMVRLKCGRVEYVEDQASVELQVPPVTDGADGFGSTAASEYSSVINDSDQHHTQRMHRLLTERRRSERCRAMVQECEKNIAYCMLRMVIMSFDRLYRRKISAAIVRIDTRTGQMDFATYGSVGVMVVSMKDARVVRSVRPDVAMDAGLRAYTLTSLVQTPALRMSQSSYAHAIRRGRSMHTLATSSSLRPIAEHKPVRTRPGMPSDLSDSDDDDEDGVETEAADDVEEEDEEEGDEETVDPMAASSSDAETLRLSSPSASVYSHSTATSSEARHRHRNGHLPFFYPYRMEQCSLTGMDHDLIVLGTSTVWRWLRDEDVVRAVVDAKLILADHWGQVLDGKEFVRAVKHLLANVVERRARTAGDRRGAFRIVVAMAV